MKKFGMLSYHDHAGFNIGDNIQSLAAKQYIPRVDELVLRDELSKVKIKDLNVIMNGWYTHYPETWLPNDNLNPFFVSFHLNSEIKDRFLGQKEIVDYLKKHQPIGCRDRNTVISLEEYGIEAYYTGCLTLTLDSYAVDECERGDDIYIVDPFFNFPDKRLVFRNLKSFVRSTSEGKLFSLGKRDKYLNKMFSKSLLKNAKYETHVFYDNGWTEERKFSEAEKLLRKYAKAKLVITSRIHCALPCLAMGTPVLFLNAFDNEIDTCRFDGLLEFFNVVNIDSKLNISAPNGISFPYDGGVILRNNESHIPQAEKLKEICKSVFNQ
ncbi:polysaccharide pyruvyl transferase family protein [Vibrio sp. 10N.222.55.F12]|uniref:polysaccharide pyruvyl transferase family protein n=1 Tax=Vibrio sp. 10N.222.55.F12 TaxID=3229653 RepID=UPI00354CE9A6